MKTVYVAASLALLVGVNRAAANPIPACEWENGETVLGFYGSGLAAANEPAPEPFPYSPNSLELQFVTPGVPLPAAHIAYAWYLDDIDQVLVSFFYYVLNPGVSQWRLQGRWNDGLPGDPQGDDGDAGGVLLQPVSGWNYVQHTFIGTNEHTGLVVTITPTLQEQDTIWIDLMVVSGVGSFITETPCYQWVPTENQTFGDVKALFH